MKAHRIAVPALVLAVAVVSAAHGQQTAEEIYQAALYQEEVQGNLEGAIGSYERILDDFRDNRSVAAKAQLHIGLCYEKLGLTEAQQAYRRVIADYPDHTDEVAVARQRLNRLERELVQLTRQPTFRKIEIASKPQNGVLSPDGNELAFVSEGAVWIVPLHGKVDPDIAGEPVQLAEVPGVWEHGSLMAWSANGEWIAVNGEPEEGDVDVVTVIPVGGGETRVVPVPDRGGHAWSYRLSLSPDGERVAVSARPPEAGPQERLTDPPPRYIYTISTVGGEPERVSPGGVRMPAFSPDGDLIAYVGGDDGDLWVVPSAGGTPIKVANVSGGHGLRGPVWSPDGKYIAAHHEGGETNRSFEVWVYPLSPDASSAVEPTKISLPRLSMNMLAGWTPDGELGVFIQSEQYDAIYTVPAEGGKAMQITSPAVAGMASPNYPRWSPDGERIYFRGWYEEETEKTRTLYIPAEGGDPVEVAVRPERWIVSQIPGGGLNVSPDGERLVIAGYQEPPDKAEGGDIWTFPVDGGRPARLTNDVSVESWPCWSPDGRSVAFTDWHALSEDEGFNAIHIIPAEGGEIRQVTSQEDSVAGGSIGGGGIAFAPDGERIAFFSSGTIKTIPVAGGQSEVLVAGVRSSIWSELAYSPDGSKIAHSAGGKIWITPLATGVPEELRTGLPEDAKLYDFSWSPDGEKIAFVASIGGEAEFWLISDFLP